MSPVGVRRALHTVHVVATLVLLATGLLIGWPDVRGRLVGGYGRELAELHLWAGWGFLAAPALAAAAAARPLWSDLARRLAPPDRLSWRNAHVVLTLAAGGALSATGILLWLGNDLPLAVVDASADVHTWTTWVVAASIPVHLVMARRKIAERVRIALGGEPPPLFEFAEDDPEDDEA